MSWLRRLSRDRTSKSDPDSFREMPIRTAPFANGDHPQSPTYKDTQYPSTPNSQDKLQSFRPARQPNAFQSSPPRLPGTAVDDVPRTPPSQHIATAPDPLTRAFNDAIRPYQDQIEMLKGEIDDKELQLQSLEEERADMHAWIDKRGLRADVPPSIARAMNHDTSAAHTLAYQLDRKMTKLNTDLHHLQDSVTSDLPTSIFSSTLLTLLPPIESLSTLPSGPALAFEQILKLAGNLNSHGGDEGWNNDADASSRAEFYNRLDDCMVEVVRQRLNHGSEENPAWMIGRDVKRLEKNGAVLRSKIGLQAYFPRTLEVLRYEVKRSETQTGRV